MLKRDHFWPKAAIESAILFWVHVSSPKIALISAENRILRGCLCMISGMWCHSGFKRVNPIRGDAPDARTHMTDAPPEMINTSWKTCYGDKRCIAQALVADMATWIPFLGSES